MAPSLPAEIIDYLLDYLSDDIQSLRATSVLDHQWSEIARRYIFRTIIFPLDHDAEPSSDLPFCPRLTMKSLDKLLLCFRRHPHLIRCVKTVSIQNTRYSFVDPDESVYAGVSLLLPQMENVRRLHLRNITWSTVSLDLRLSVIQLVANSPLTQLTTRALTIGAPDLIQLLSSTPRLELLRSDRIWIPLDDMSPVPPLPEVHPVTLNRLRSLHLEASGKLGRIFPNVIPPHTLTTLTHLDLDTTSYEDDVVEDLLKTPLASLRHLELSRLTRNVTMKLPTHLISLSISQFCNLVVLYRILQQVDGPVALEQISIVVVGISTFIKPHECVPHLEIIDECLTRPYFHCLKAVTFLFRPVLGGDVREHELLTRLRRSMVNVYIVRDASASGS